MTPRHLRATALALATGLMVAACSSATESGERVDPADWPAVLEEADGQTVSWYMFGGDETLNTFVDDVVTPRLAEQGVTLQQVRITDTAEAVNTVLGEKQAGRTEGGAVDAIWLNGENFATGVQADIWACDWAEQLPNARYVELDDPSVASDFGVPVNGCEAVWQQASSALVYDFADLEAADVASADSLLDWVRDNPGRFAYPAPPDFTGSMAVRQLLYADIADPSRWAGAVEEEPYRAVADPFWERLNALEPSLWRGGETYPTSQDDVERLYADGEISAYFTYGPGAVGQRVEDGVFPESTRQAVLAEGNIGNHSFIAIPENAGSRAAAFVLANTLQEPEVQLALFESAGIYPGIDVSRTDDAVQQAFDDVPRSPSVLSLDDLTADVQPELSSAYLARIEDDWTTLVLQQ
ncbi:ABC transporter substrate-binding protein [Cytobacillus oceanisediminis]